MSTFYFLPYSVIVKESRIYWESVYDLESINLLSVVKNIINFL